MRPETRRVARYAGPLLIVVGLAGALLFAATYEPAEEAPKTPPPTSLAPPPPNTSQIPTEPPGIVVVEPTGSPATGTVEVPSATKRPVAPNPAAPAPVPPPANPPINPPPPEDPGLDINPCNLLPLCDPIEVDIPPLLG